MRSLLPSTGDADVAATYLDAARRPPPGRPWVLANFVAGLDGAVAVGGRVGPLSNPADKALFKLLRTAADVILVGAGTVRAEGYGPARVPPERREERRARGQAEVPAIAVVTATLQLDWSSPLFAAAEARPIVVTARAADSEAVRRAAEVADVIVAGDDRVDLAAALGALAERGTSVVLTEGGPTLLAGLLDLGLLDELCLTLAPFVGGDPGGIVADGALADLVGFRLGSVLEEDGHLYLRYLRGGDHG
jgi:riboflavin biosynthesis pyrimidine reductase